MGKICLRDGDLSQNTDLTKETIQSHSKCLKEHQGKIIKRKQWKRYNKRHI